MNNITKITTGLAAIAGLALAASSAHALTPTETPTAFTSGVYSGFIEGVNDLVDEQAYSGDQSAIDLLNGLTATQAVGWNLTNGSEVKDLNDGIHGAFPGNQADGLWSDEGAFVEYNLGANALGYDITSIQSIASWKDSGFGNQVWTVEVKVVGGVDYDLLATIDYTPIANSVGATKVNLTGLDATGIEFIKFTAGSTGGKSVGDDFVWREMDVFGSATVPEPSTSALLGGLLALGAVMTRRRSA